MAKKIIDFEQFRNDLFAEFDCECCRQKVKLSGYNDDNFFNNVNKDFRQLTHKGCKTVHLYKWTIDGVIIKLEGDK